MTALYCIEKLEQKLLPKVNQLHFVGWADCGRNQCDRLVRQPNESKEKLFRRVKHNNPNRTIFCLNSHFLKKFLLTEDSFKILIVKTININLVVTYKINKFK